MIPKLSAGRSSERGCSDPRRGFSIIELLIVVVVILIVAAFAVPYFLTASYQIRLKSGVSNLSGFLQEARIRAARQDATYSIGYQVVNGVQEAYLDLNLNGRWDANEPLITFPASITPASGAPTGTAPTPYVLVGDTAGTIYDNHTTLAFSPRGLPCAFVASGNVCNTPAAGYFVYYFNDQRASSIGWAAVVVTRSGRSKVVMWNGAAWQ